MRLMGANPLVSDRDVEFVLHELLDVGALCRLPHFRDHSPDTFELYLRTSRRLARELLLPSYRAVDAAPARLENGAVRIHPALREIYPQLVALGAIAATRPAEVGGQQLPH